MALSDFMPNGLLALMRRRPRPIPRGLIPEEVRMTPPADAMPPMPAMRRHRDLGSYFEPEPKPRTDAGRAVAVRAGLVTLDLPAGQQIEVRFQLGNGDWTPWRAASAGATANHVAAIAGQWRIRGEEA